MKAAKAFPEMARKEQAKDAGEALPLLKAFTVERCKDGWRFVIVNYRDDCTIETIEKSEPDVKPIILERFKIAVAKHWMAG